MMTSDNSVEMSKADLIELYGKLQFIATELEANKFPGFLENIENDIKNKLSHIDKESKNVTSSIKELSDKVSGDLHDLSKKIDSVNGEIDAKVEKIKDVGEGVFLPFTQYEGFISLMKILVEKIDMLDGPAKHTKTVIGNGKASTKSIGSGLPKPSSGNSEVEKLIRRVDEIDAKIDNSKSEILLYFKKAMKSSSPQSKKKISSWILYAVISFVSFVIGTFSGYIFLS